ncbi:hypothetical protein CVT24_002477 [Panaeolus cyanescens]|uniref:F-box domain-containing protein n=1 Tax=Panaeolus cyanescens TaxID=181874 RepID=A0A409YTM7_9AGAR|nr:hypothetical protein CVT24_002477 [Panaeolus cyanescens]
MLTSHALDECLLPIEIFDLIIKEVVGGSNRQEALSTLRTCSLVCKAFIDLCRPHIFSTVTYGPYGHLHETRKNLGKLLTKQPKIRTYVKNVKYIMDIEDDPPINEAALVANAKKRFGAKADHRPAAPEVFSEENLRADSAYFAHLDYQEYIMTAGRVDAYRPTLALLITHAESLSIHHSRCHTADMATGTACTDKRCLFFLNTMLEEMSTQDTIRSISIMGFADLRMWMVMDSPNLQHLHLDTCLLDDWNCPPGVVLGRREIGLPPLSSIIKLKTITVRAVDNFAFSIIQYCKDLESVSIFDLDFGSEVPSHLDKSKRITSFPKLRNMRIDKPRNWVPFCSLSESSGLTTFPALTHLDVFLGEVRDSQHINRLISHSRILEDLTVRIGVQNDNFKLLNPTAWLQTNQSTLKSLTLLPSISVYDDEDPLIRVLCDGLSKIKGNNHLETLVINITYHRYMVGLNIFVPKFEQWKRFDTLFTSNRVVDFPKLKNLSISIHFTAGPIRPIRDIPNFWAGLEFLRGPLKRLHADGSRGINFSCKITHAIR